MRSPKEVPGEPEGKNCRGFKEAGSTRDQSANLEMPSLDADKNKRKLLLPTNNPIPSPHPAPSKPPGLAPQLCQPHSPVIALMRKMDSAWDVLQPWEVLRSGCRAQQLPAASAPQWKPHRPLQQAPTHLRRRPFHPEGTCSGFQSWLPSSTASSSNKQAQRYVGTSS